MHRFDETIDSGNNQSLFTESDKCWDQQQFLAILDTEIAQQCLKEPNIADLCRNWAIEVKACLFHANGITATSDPKQSLQRLQLVAAFSRKDVDAIKNLVNLGVTVGTRLDYFLPIYDEATQAGEDIFVAATKVMLKGNRTTDVNPAEFNMHHYNKANAAYTDKELQQLSAYVNDAFKIRQCLMNAPNKTVVQPTLAAVDYVLRHAKRYRDSNQNPVPVFIPGAININKFSATELITAAINNGGHVNEVGFFGVSGIVWSIILGDVDAVRHCLKNGAKTRLKDEMGNHSIQAWAMATLSAIHDLPCPNVDHYHHRMLTIIQMLYQNDNADIMANSQGLKPMQYLNETLQTAVRKARLIKQSLSTKPEMQNPKQLENTVTTQEHAQRQSLEGDSSIAPWAASIEPY